MIMQDFKDVDTSNQASSAEKILECLIFLGVIACGIALYFLGHAS